SFFNTNWQNVMFTLALVLVTVWIIDFLKTKMQSKPKALWYIVSLLIVGVMCIVAMMLSLDYEHHAILIGYFFYLFHDMPIFAIPFGYASMYESPWALLGFSLTLTYNGERGRQNKILNYLFYPVHMLILGILRLCLGV
ncbi:MAG: TraX family protein, partial [Acutalibacteraceae bacterium]|nr:TraX family protein [Acutalibacteraceae bacterium]